MILQSRCELFESSADAARGLLDLDHHRVEGEYKWNVDEDGMTWCWMRLLSDRFIRGLIKGREMGRLTLCDEARGQP